MVVPLHEHQLLKSDRVAILALKMSFRIDNRCSTASLDGMAVLNLVNSFISTGSPKKATLVVDTSHFRTVRRVKYTFSLVKHLLWLFRNSQTEAYVHLIGMKKVR